MLRPKDPDQSNKVTNVELFFDLVFVYAITQVSHMLMTHLSLLGALQSALLFLAIWWVWVYTAWFTNWLDPDRTAVRVLIFTLMFLGLLMSAAMPDAFGHRGLVFAVAYVTMQIGRTCFIVWALHAADHGDHKNFLRILCWLLASGVFWLAGGIYEGNTRLALWAVGLGLEYVSPSLGFWTPGLGQSKTSDWEINGRHLAERCSQFLIIVLGELLLVTGAAFAALDWTMVSVTGLALAFLSSIAMWWIYFNTGAERGSQHIGESDEPGRLARLSYTYVHLLIVGGVLVAAVADEVMLTRPEGKLELPTIVAVIGGPATYLLGNGLFKRAFAGRFPASHLIGCALLALLAAASSALEPLALYSFACGCLVVVALWETVALRAWRFGPT